MKKETVIPFEETPEEFRLTPDDPVLKALNTMAETLKPFNRKQQLKILASACIELEMLDHAESFLGALRE